MGKTRFTRIFIFIALLLSGVIVSCQKDQSIKDGSAAKPDSSLIAPDNYLAVKGTLTITIQDSTYSFDAAKDSVAFVNVHGGDSSYFGITAINKAHNMSFGISSIGHATNNVVTPVAGSQFILRPDNKPNIQYALTDHAIAQDFGKISITSYKQDTVLAKGTFYTFLAKGDVVKTPATKVKGTFNLQLK
jgi:hypothetical protein